MKLLIPFILFSLFAITAVKAQQQETTDSISNHLNFKHYPNYSIIPKQPFTLSTSTIDKSFQNQNYLILVLPQYCLGAFCKFENYLNYKKKIPVNFGTD